MVQHWKEFELNIMPCRFALIPLNLIADMLLNLSAKGRNFVAPNIHLLSLHKPRKGPGDLYLEQVRRESGIDKKVVE